MELMERQLPAHCEVQVGPLEKEGTTVEFLGRTKVRTKDAILTIPDEKHQQAIWHALGITTKDRSKVPSKQLDLLQVQPLEAAEAAPYRSAVGSAICLSAEFSLQ